MKEESSSVMAFDALYTNNQIQKLKVLLPYVEPAMQKQMAIYIKYRELQYTMQLFQKHPFQICSACEKNKPDFRKLCHELKPYSSESEIQQLEQITSLFQAMEMYQEMSQTMSSMQGFDDNTSMESFLMGMLSPEQKSMFEVFNSQMPAEPSEDAPKEEK